MFCLEPPTEGYEVVVPEWEVEVTPGGPMVNLNGTVQEVHYQLTQLNPDWNEQYMTESETETAQEEVNSPNPSHLSRRTDFSGAHYQCDNWPKGKTVFLQEGINYLRKVNGRPTSGPGPGKCARVSCSWNSAIWWCNDVSTLTDVTASLAKSHLIEL